MTCLTQLGEEFWCSICLYLLISRKTSQSDCFGTRTSTQCIMLGGKEFRQVIDKYIERNIRELTGLKFKFNDGRSVVNSATPGENTYI